MFWIIRKKESWAMFLNVGGDVFEDGGDHVEDEKKRGWGRFV